MDPRLPESPKKRMRGLLRITEHSSGAHGEREKTTIIAQKLVVGKSFTNLQEMSAIRYPHRRFDRQLLGGIFVQKTSKPYVGQGLTCPKGLLFCIEETNYGDCM